MRIWLIGGSVNGLLGILSGLIGGHAAMPALVAGDGIVRMGEHYQFWHAAALLALAVLPGHIMIGWLRLGGLCILIGATIFGLSVQIAAIANFPALLPVAWGASFLLALGWIFLLFGAIRIRE